MTDITISASILSADFANLTDQIRLAESAGVDWIHIDVMDGSFVPNITMGPFIVETIHRITHLPLDVHLMIDNPDRHLEAFAQAGAANLTVHIENTPNIHRTLQEIENLGCHPCIALNPGTPANRLEAILPVVDMILVMTVNPGFSGQKHIAGMVSKVAQVQRMLTTQSRTVRIEVDGGVNAANLPDLVIAGANTIVSATSVFKYPGGIAAGVQALRSSVA
jgi:ribulose-phosphate 3-epimerase